jgi:hypothetical protein
MNRGAAYEFGRESADDRSPRQHGPRFTIRIGALAIPCYHFFSLALCARHPSGLIGRVIPDGWACKAVTFPTKRASTPSTRAPGVGSTWWTSFATSSASVSSPNWAHGASTLGRFWLRNNDYFPRDRGQIHLCRAARLCVEGAQA